MLFSVAVAQDLHQIMLRPEFGPLHVARFHVSPDKEGLIGGYEVHMYQIVPSYHDVGRFTLFTTDLAHAYALYLPAGRLPYGSGRYRYRLIAMYKDGTQKDLGFAEHEVRRVLLRGVSPLRVEWTL